MIYNSMYLSNHITVVPAYMNNEQRMLLRKKIMAGGLKMYCGCSLFSETKLEYSISVDGRFVPCHQGYVHDENCMRGGVGKRKLAYIASDDGTSRAYLGFNVFGFSVSPLSSSSSSKGNSSKNDEEKEPLDNLGNFILQLNTDVYRERYMSGKGLLSADYFLSALHGRLKNVYIDGVKKPLKELSLDEDYVAFFYSPLLNVEIGNSCRVVLKGWNRPYSQFIFDSTLQRAINDFEDRYNIPLSEAIGQYNVMAAGFVYMRLSKKNELYRVVGRLHLFIVNNNGLYCRSLEEVSVLNSVDVFMRVNRRFSKIMFNRTLDPNVVGIFSREDKRQVLLCSPSKPRGIAKEGAEHVVVCGELVNEELLSQVAELLDV